MLSTIRLETYFTERYREIMETNVGSYDLYFAMFNSKLEEIILWTTKPKKLEEIKVNEFLRTLNCLELEVQEDLDLLEDVQKTIDKVLEVSII